jgi:hypothetical protein
VVWCLADPDLHPGQVRIAEEGAAAGPLVWTFAIE